MNNRTYLANAQKENRNEWKSADASNPEKTPINMLYVKHNLRDNYFSANGLGDERMKRDIIISEIAKMIVNRPADVISALNRNGVKTSTRPTHKELVGKVSDAMHNSQKFTTDLVSMFAVNKRPMSADGSAAQTTGTQTTGVKTQDYAAMAAGTADTVKFIGGLFGGKKKRKAQEAKDRAAAAEAARQKALAQSQLNHAVKGVSGGKDTESNLMLYVGIGVGSALLITLAVVMYVKYKNKNKAQ